MPTLFAAISKNLFDAAAASIANSISYGLPVRATIVTWQTSFGSAPASCTILLQGSNDNVTWNTIDTSTAVGGEIRTITTAVTFVRARINAISGGAEVTVSLIAKVVQESGNITNIYENSTPPAGPIASQTTYLVSGGEITWQEDYTFLVSAASYYIGGVLTASIQTEIVLDAAHATLDRIDVIVVDVDGNVLAVTGTPAAQPSEPDIDPGSQLKLGIILVTANTTEPANITDELLFADDAGSPTEWDWSVVGSGFSIGTNQPRNGTHSIEGTSVASAAYAVGEIGSGFFDPNSVDLLVLYIKSKAAWQSNRGLQISLRLNGVIVGNTITIRASNSFGFVSSNTTTYQQIAIPISLFAIPSGGLINQIRISKFGSGANIGFYIDDISFQGGIVTQPVDSFTQAEADARYARISSATRAITFAIDGGGNPLTTGVKAEVYIPYACIITAVTLIADQSGDVELDILAGLYAAFPTIGSIVAAAPPELTADQKYQDTVLTGWTRTIAPGTILQFEIVSIATITRLNCVLTVTT